MCAFNPPDWSVARSELRDLLAADGWPASLIADAELALHELFVNAWKHAGSPAPLVTLALSPRRLRVSVCDDSPVLPEEPCAPADPLSLSGRGLHLVRALTHRFGVDLRKQGKAIWFELEVTA
ncbi:ATP-binding protein [Streptomyces sp. FH025]|uniref:ATP-binding protein n=1 Tax=Streptomyces sp. FH025 TaxID=2815937 RepID=UPI001A9FD14A|nr:ATP-binding protein [Streptomyces sp. FH025]MBO1417814.1 ATP-binding protein [Streptomyces sp. FH025]